MATEALDHGMAVDTGCEPWPYADHQRSVVNGGVDIALRKPSIHYDIGSEPRQLGRNDHPDLAVAGDTHRLADIGSESPDHALDLDDAVFNRGGQRHRSADSQRFAQLTDQHRKPCPGQAPGDAGGKISSPSENAEIRIH